MTCSSRTPDPVTLASYTFAGVSQTDRRSTPDAAAVLSFPGTVTAPAAGGSPAAAAGSAPRAGAL